MPPNEEKVNNADISQLQQLPAVSAPNSAMVNAEIGSTFAAAQAKAMVEARYVMAIKQPRNMDQVRQSILAECKRPSFAHNKSAYYVKPIGDGAEGLGIRFAEVALRHMKNVLIESPMVFEDGEREVHEVIITDLESNATYRSYVRVSKFVERNWLQEGQQYFGVRKNSRNKNVYLVLGTEDDLLNKRAALISKAIRTLALRLVPGDIQDEAETIIKKIRLDKAAEDPTAERKLIADSFFDLNVSAEMLTEYLGHDLAQCSPAELVKLRGIFGAIRDGELTWGAVMENREAPAPKAEKKEAAKKKEPVTLDLTSGGVDASGPPLQNGAEASQDARQNIEESSKADTTDKVEVTTRKGRAAPTLE